MKRNKIETFVFKYNRIIFMLAAVAFLTIACPNTFFTGTNFSNMMFSAALYGIMASGMFFAAIVSGPDLACGGIAAVASMIVVTTMAKNAFSMQAMLLGILLALLAGAAIGLLEGVLSFFLNAPSFLITLAFQYILFGVAKIGLEGKIWSCTQNAVFNALGTYRLWGLPMPVYVFVLIALLIWFISRKTVFGRQAYAVGGNPKASNLIGISVKKTMFFSFMISGITSAVAGVLLAAMTQQGTAAAGVGYEGDVLLCVVMGGIELGGGVGSALGAAYGAVFVSMMGNGLRLLGVSSYGQNVIRGLIIVAVVAFECFSADRVSGLVRRTSTKKKEKATE